MSTPPACITTNPFLFVHEIMITHHQPQSLSSTIPLYTVYKLILYHPLNPWFFVHEPILHRLQAHPVSSTKPTLFRPQTHSAPPTSSSCIIHWTHGISSTNSLCALSKPSLHCLRPNVLYSFAQGLLLHNTKKEEAKNYCLLLLLL